MTLVDGTDPHSDARRLDRGQRVVGADPVTREPDAIGTDHDGGSAEQSLDADVSGAANAAHLSADLFADAFELEEVVAEDRDLDVGARAADELVRLVLDGLRDRDGGTADLALDGVLDGDGEVVELVRGGPLLLRPEVDEDVGVVVADRIDGHLGATGHGERGDDLRKSLQHALGGEIELFGLREADGGSAPERHHEIALVDAGNEVGAGPREHDKGEHQGGTGASQKRPFQAKRCVEAPGVRVLEGNDPPRAYFLGRRYEGDQERREENHRVDERAEERTRHRHRHGAEHLSLDALEG